MFRCLQLSHVMRKPAFCMHANKGIDQFWAADHWLCFRYLDSTIPLFPKSKISSLSIFYGCTARFVWDLVVNHKDRFSCNMAQLCSSWSCFQPKLSLWRKEPFPGTRMGSQHSKSRFFKMFLFNEKSQI